MSAAAGEPQSDSPAEVSLGAGGAPAAPSGWRRLGNAALWLLAGVYALFQLMPWQPSIPHSLHVDASWMYTLHLAYDRSLVYGRDIVFTYGPLGFLFVDGYYPGHWGMQLATWAVVAAVIVFSTWSLSRQGSGGWPGPLLAGVLVTALGASLRYFCDPVAFAVCALLLLVRLRGQGHTWHGTLSTAALTVVAAAYSLGKFSWLLCAVGVVVILSADDLLLRRPRRIPWVAPLYVAATGVFWCWVGQPLSAFGSFLGGGWRITQGYSEAMSLAAPGEGLEAALYVGCALSLLVLVALGHRRQPRWIARTAPTTVGLAMILWLAMKAGFVRHDIHMVIASWLLVALVVIGGFIPRPGLRTRRWAGAYLLPVLLATCLAVVVASRYGGPSVADLLSPSRLCEKVPARIGAVWSACRGTARGKLDREHADTMKELRQALALPAMPGTVDIYSHDQMLAVAHNLQFSSRPVFQSYSAYTSELAALNAAHLDSERAPQWIILRLSPIDMRFPSLDDAASWPLLWTRYRVAGEVDSWLCLERCPPRAFSFTPMPELRTTFGAPVTLPASAEGLVWARIDVQPTALDRLCGVVYRPPMVRIRVELADGQRGMCRLVPAMARSGFLLSPLVMSSADFAGIAREGEAVMRPGGRLAAQRITRMTIESEAEHSNWFFQPSIRVELSSLRFTPSSARQAAATQPTSGAPQVAPR